jgi:NDP-sugar pyrophosphorylase family protein
MKVAIFTGGKGSQLTEKIGSKSKAMVKGSDHPILWHIIR